MACIPALEYTLYTGSRTSVVVACALLIAA